MKRLTVIVLPLALAAAAAACEPAPPPPPPPPQNTSAPPMFEADSIGSQWDLADGRTINFPDSPFNATMGATITTCPLAGCTPPSQDLAAKVAQGKAYQVLVEIGTNDSSPLTGGWTRQKATTWLSVIGGLPADTSAVIVLPWVGDGAPADLVTQIGLERASMVDLAAALPNVYTVDWQPYASRPGVLGPDGIHMAGPDGQPPVIEPGGHIDLAQVAIDAWTDMAHAGFAECPARTSG